MPSTTPSSSTPTASAQESFRRATAETSDRAAEVARAQARASRAYLADSFDVARAAWTTWAQLATAGLQVAFQMQNSLLDATLTAYDTSTATTRQALQTYLGFTRQAQRGMSEFARGGFRPFEQPR